MDKKATALLKEALPHLKDEYQTLLRQAEDIEDYYNSNLDRFDQQVNEIADVVSDRATVDNEQLKYLIQDTHDYLKAASSGDTNAIKSVLDKINAFAKDSNLDIKLEGSDLSGKQKDLDTSKLSILEASSKTLATANDPLNKTLRGIADHISTKLDGSDKSLNKSGLENSKEMQKGIQKQPEKHSEKQAEHNEMHL